MSTTIRTLSLGAGVQSTALLALAADGVIDSFDAAIFSDTGWEPAEVYDHLDRIVAEIAEPAGIPVHRVSNGHIRDDALNPEHRFASMPLFTVNDDGSHGMARRQCTNEYKLVPIKREVRRLLGYPHPTRVPTGVHAEVAIGISTDEIGRARDSDVRYMHNTFPLLDLGMSRADCVRYLASKGFGHTPKSACVGCPFSGNRRWRQMRDQAPEEFADAVEFDHAIRKGSARANAQGIPLRGRMFLHSARVPLDEAPIDRVTPHEWRQAQGDVFDAVADQLAEDGDPDGCSPWTCRSGEPAA